MKILAFEIEVEGATWHDAEKILEEEAQHVFQLYLSNILREIYFTENQNAVLILETKTKKEAEKLLNNLPLVKHGMIEFELMELKPYTGFERIITK